MGGSYSHELFTGIRLDAETIASLKNRTQRFRPLDPKTKFDPDTGKPNEPTQKEYWDEEWKSEFAFMDVTDYEREDYDDLLNSGVDFHGFKIVEPHSDSEREFYIIGDRHSLNEGEPPNKLDTDLKELRADLKAAFEPLGLWKDEWFGIWHVCSWY